MLEPQKFRFRTRVQRLNSLSADARASLNYQEQLQKFHAQQGRARVSIPIIDRRPVDLYNLKLTVSAYGGFENVGRMRKWAEVTRRLGYDEKDSSHLAAQVKAAYYKIILPFETFLLKAKEQAKFASVNNSPAGPPNVNFTARSITPMSAPAGRQPSERATTPSRMPSSGQPNGRTESSSPVSGIAKASSALQQSVSAPVFGSATPEPASISSFSQELLAAGLTPDEVAQAEADAASGGKRRSSRKRSEFVTGERLQRSVTDRLS